MQGTPGQLWVKHSIKISQGVSKTKLVQEKKTQKQHE